MKTLFDLRRSDCRWPLGPQFERSDFFCAEPVKPGKVYCAAHCAVAYTGVHYRPTGQPSVNLQTGAGRLPTLPRQEAAA